MFQVEELDFEGRKAHVRAVDCDYYTTAITYTKVTILDRFAEDAPNVAHHGEVHVVSRVVGFKKIKFHTNENVGSGELDLPEQQMHTTAYWLEMPLAIMNALPYADRRSPRRRLRPGVCDEAGRAAAADVRRARHRLVGQCRRDATATIRRESSSTTRTPAASASARRCWACSGAAVEDQRAHRQLRLRERLPDVRRADRGNRSAREDRRAAHSSSICSRRPIAATLKRVALRATGGRSVLAMATLDRLRDIVRSHRPSPVPVVAPRGIDQRSRARRSPFLRAPDHIASGASLSAARSSNTPTAP